jgi:hypothetical protein
VDSRLRSNDDSRTFYKTIKVGPSFVTIDDNGIFINGPRVNLNSGGTPGNFRGVFVQEPETPLPPDTAGSGLPETNPTATACSTI